MGRSGSDTHVLTHSHVKINIPTRAHTFTRARSYMLAHIHTCVGYLLCGRRGRAAAQRRVSAFLQVETREDFDATLTRL
jgi:hypothetical protein